MDEVLVGVHAGGAPAGLRQAVSGKVEATTGTHR